MKSVYLAGPDVFRPDAAEHGRALVALCAGFGWKGVFPLDPSIEPGPSPAGTARRIFQANIERIEACDAVLANLDFFRGAEPDSGTCFEVGYAVARGKPVVGYFAQGGTLAQRIAARQPQLLGAPGLDRDGWQVEEFGLPLNLMLAVPCTLVVGDARAALAVLRELPARG